MALFGSGQNWASEVSSSIGFVTAAPLVYRARATTHVSHPRGSMNSTGRCVACRLVEFWIHGSINLLSLRLPFEEGQLFSHAFHREWRGNPLWAETFCMSAQADDGLLGELEGSSSAVGRICMGICNKILFCWNDTL